MRRAITILVIASLTALVASEIGTAQDLRLLSFSAPVAVQGTCLPLSNAEQVTIRLLSLSAVPIAAGTSVPVQYTVDDGNGPVTVNETWIVPTTMNQFALEFYTFSATVDMSTPGVYTFDATASLPGDTNPGNDTVTGYTVQSGGVRINSFPWLENFDGAMWSGTGNGSTVFPAGWINDPNDNPGMGGDVDWYLRNLPTTSAQTGPPGDHTSGTGFFAYVEDSGGNFPQVNLLTPCIDVSALSSPTLRFWIHSNDGTNMGMNQNLLSLDVIDEVTGMATLDIIPAIGHLGNMWVEQIVDLTPYSTSLFRLRFRVDSTNGGTNNFTHDIAIDDVEVFDANVVDVELLSLDAPVSSPPTTCVPLASTEPVTITLRNRGLMLPAATAIPVSFTLDGGMPVNETLTLAAPLMLGQSVSYTFSQTADLSALGNHTIDVSAMAPGDVIPANDALTGVVIVSGGGTPISTYPYVENFDGTMWNGTGNGSTVPPPGWTQETMDSTGSGSDWFFRNQPTTSFNTGPNADHTTGVAGQGYFAYVEDSISNLTAVSLRTPCFDLTVPLSNPTLEFWVSSLEAGGGVSPNTLHIDAITYAGGGSLPTVILDVVPPIGDLGTADWQAFAVPLGSFAGLIAQVRFRIDSTNGGANTFTHDIAIDDVRVFDLVPGNGQPPQPGLAVLDVNQATEINGFGVQSGVNGPYSTSIVSGDLMNIDVSGVPNQPIILVTGPLNVGVANFPGIGQLDLGIFLGGGIPGGLIVISDGLTGSGFLPQFFNTGLSGTMSISISLNAPIGSSFPLQVAVFNGGPSVVSLSNLVDVTVM